MNHNASTAVRVVVVDDHPLFRLGIRSALGNDPRLHVVGDGSCFKDAIQLGAHADLMTLDMNLEDSSGLSLIEQLHARYPDLRILVVSMLDEVLYAERCVRAGASGYLAKAQAATRLVDAVDRVLAGDVYFGDQVLRKLAMRVASGGTAEDPISSLSPRELEVFQLMGLGHRARAIADILHLSQKTVETHQAKLKRKLGADSAYQLLWMAMTWNHGGDLADTAAS